MDEISFNKVPQNTAQQDKNASIVISGVFPTVQFPLEWFIDM